MKHKNYTQKQKKVIGNTNSKPFSATLKFFLIFSMSLFMLSFVIAPIEIRLTKSILDFDNSKRVIEHTGQQYPELRIENTFGLGKDIWLGNLTKNTDDCYDDCSAETTITITEATELVSDVRFMMEGWNGRRSEIEIESYNFYIKSAGNWIPYQIGEVLVAGTYELRLEGDKGNIATVDWQIKTNGKWLNEWADWSGTLNDNLFAYWKMEDQTSELNTSIYNLLNAGTQPTFQPGIIGDASNFSGTNHQGWNTTLYNQESNFNETGDEFTISFWINQTSLTGTQSYIINRDDDTFAGWFINFNAATNVIRANDFNGVGVFNSNPITSDRWYHIVLRKNSTDLAFIINGTLDTQTTNTAPANTNLAQQPISIGMDSDGTSVMKGRIDEIGMWKRALTDAEISDLYNSGSAVTYPFPTGITLNSPGANELVTEGFFNCSAVIPTGSSATITNITLWHDLSGTFQRNESNTTASTLNESTFNLTSIPSGFFNWGCSAGDSDGAEGFSVNRTLNSNIIKNKTTFNTTTLVTSSELFIGEFTTVGSPTITNPLVIYNGTAHTGTVTTNGDNFNISATLDVPSTTGTANFHYDFSVNSVNFSTNVSTQSFTDFELGICDATLGDNYVNFTFADENNETTLNSSIPTSNFTYYLGTGDTSKELIYTNTTTHFSYALCANPNNETLNINSRIQYESPGYQQRVYDPIAIAYTNTTTNTTLYLLSDVDGIFVTFQVVNNADQIIGGVFVNATRLIGSSQQLVGEGFTDSSGGLTMWLDPDFVHIFNFEKVGFTTLTSSFAPTQTSYTINLGTNTSTTTNDLTRGIAFNITPLFNSPLYDAFDYLFSLNLSSSFYTVDEFGIVLSNTTDILSTNSSTVNGGSVDFTYNVSGQDNLELQYWWKINNTYMNASNFYVVLASGGTEWSINRTVSDFRIYLGEGMFGMDDFAVALLIFMVLMISVGIMSFKFGLTSPTAMSVLIFAVILFLDVGLNLMSTLNPFGVPHFITIFAALIMGSILMRGLR